ncbi:Uncharacterised protein [BD1-7 clade bacterium]|uniref:Uncharacterized protein n=1 Tax=BD1-7 clade bacterium TaxID=2029982 RepID=A0A5S9PGQ2_9GAMM|nr:Uncharacterised protein [BD1-7 clade bacterium]
MAPKHPLTDQGKNVAVFYSQSEYRKNGYDYIVKTARRKKRYANNQQIGKGLRAINRRPKDQSVTPGSDTHANLYHFNIGNNFKHWRVPYDHQAHHLLPKEFNKFLKADATRKICAKLNYNINRGENIVYLPYNNKYAKIHDLPIHCGSHPKYNNEVLRMAADFENKLKQYVQTEPCQETKDLPKDLVDEMIALSDDLWKIVTEAGQVKIDDVKKKRKKR